MQQRWFTSYYEDETLAYHARPCQFVTLSRFSYALYTAIRLRPYLSSPSLLSVLLLCPIRSSFFPLRRSFHYCHSSLSHCSFPRSSVSIIAGRQALRVPSIPTALSLSLFLSSIFPIRLSFYISVRVTYVHLPPSVSFLFLTSVDLLADGRKARVSRFVIARSHLS